MNSALAVRYIRKDGVYTISEMFTVSIIRDLFGEQCQVVLINTVACLGPSTLGQK
jgi:hypothetical protein